MSFVWLLCVAACVSGCSRADRVINRADGAIKVGPPKVMWTDRMPVAASRDGTRIALLLTTDAAGSIEVLDFPSMRVIARTDLTEKSEFAGPLFSLDGSRLMLGAIREGDPTPYALNLQSNDLEKMDTKADPVFVAARCNYDRTIMVDAPFLPDPTGKKPTPVLTASGHGFEIPSDARWGFDQFGVLWSKSAGTWTRITREGESTLGSAPKGGLVPDQSNVRGSLELRATSANMEFKGATARVSSIWMWDHKAIPFPDDPQSMRGHSYQAALVFTAPDIDSFGFVPGQDLVYIVSSQGNYLIPFETKDAQSVPPPATK